MFGTSALGYKAVQVNDGKIGLDLPKLGESLQLLTSVYEHTVTQSQLGSVVHCLMSEFLL